MTYSQNDAVAMLDRLINDHVVSGAELVRGTIALALYANAAGGAATEDAIRLLADLEALILGDIVGFDAAKMDRTIRVFATFSTGREADGSLHGLH